MKKIAIFLTVFAVLLMAVPMDQPDPIEPTPEMVGWYLGEKIFELRHSDVAVYHRPFSLYRRE